ncbi:MAG: DUF1822 family protein [Almyronema sp.]
MLDSHFPDFEPLSPVSIPLSADQVHWAADLTATLSEADQQWQSYLLALAVQGLWRWLSETAPDLKLSDLPTTAPLGAVTCYIGDFKLSLLASGSFSDEAVRVPLDVVKPGDTHLYVLAEVQEEYRQVAIAAALRHDQLISHWQHQPLTPTAKGDYALPLAWFTTSAANLLLYLRHAEAATLLSPGVAPQPAATAESPFLNVARWLHDQLDDIAQQFTWTLLPEPARAMRSPTEEFETILSDLATNQIAIPSRAKAAFTELQVGGIPLRLYALMWTIYDDPDQPEWSLMLFLGSASEEPMPVGTRLEVRDQDTLLAKQTLQDQANSFYLYAQVFGHWHETFHTTIALPSGPQLHLPPFGLQL